VLRPSFLLLLECGCFAAALVYLPLKYWLVGVAFCLLWVRAFLFCCGVTVVRLFSIVIWLCGAALFYCDLAEWCGSFLLWGDCCCGLFSAVGWLIVVALFSAVG